MWAPSAACDAMSGRGVVCNHSGVIGYWRGDRQDRKGFKRTTRGRVRSELEDRVRVPGF